MHGRKQSYVWAIHGNSCADKAAVNMRKTDLPEFHDLCQQVAEFYKNPKAMHTKILYYLFDLAYARLSTTPASHDQPAQVSTSDNPRRHPS